jgi:hypothetical protein
VSSRGHEAPRRGLRFCGKSKRFLIRRNNTIGAVRIHERLDGWTCRMGHRRVARSKPLADSPSALSIRSS